MFNTQLPQPRIYTFACLLVEPLRPAGLIRGVGWWVCWSRADGWFLSGTVASASKSAIAHGFAGWSVGANTRISQESRNRGVPAWCDDGLDPERNRSWDRVGDTDTDAGVRVACPENLHN